MKLKKGKLTLFYKFLAEGKSDSAKNYISLADARVRDQLASKQLFDVLHDFEEARKKIYMEFCIKGEDGEPELLMGNYQFNPKDVEKVNAEVKILEDEEVEIKVENPGKIITFLSNSKYSPAVGDTVVLDEVIAKIAEAMQKPKNEDGDQGTD